MNRESRGSRSPLRIALFNAASGSRLDGIARCLSRAPLNRAAIILLCEVDWRTRRTSGREVAAELAAMLGMSFAYVPEFGLVDRAGAVRSYMGNAILSAEPFEEVRAVPLPDMGDLLPGRRGLPAGLITRANYGGAPVTVAVVHLHSRCSPAERELQMRTFLADFPERGPAILGGDFNTTTMELRRPRAILGAALYAAVAPARFHAPQRFEPLFTHLDERGFEIDGVNARGCPTFTFARLVPPRLRPKLDWLAVRELSPVRDSAAVIPARPSAFSLRVSDHDFVVADVEL
ncbi:MAG TPA: endonuclease/exonuclease/phosphatase family protein [Candidatus Binataceae bacterium]|nr:endonuclease/exonuclease/phosphatase family protein [Candidatus Binataceae bacterium]